VPTDVQRESNFEDASLAPKLTKDLELAAEAAYAKLSADHEALTKRYADFLTRFERLEDSHEQLLSHSKEADRELEALRSSNNDERANFITRLQAQVQEQNDLIATQEQQMETDRVIKERDQKELASLRPAAARLIEAEDKLKELKNDITTLTKKANMVDHFKQKLELQKSIERENDNLRRRIDVLEENQKEFDRVHEENAKHIVTATEYEKRFASYENDVLQLSNQRRNLEEELRNQYDEVSRLQSRQQHDERFIESLQEQIRTNTAGPPPSPSSPRAVRSGPLSLEEELEQSDDTTTNYALENSRLKAEIQVLKSSNAGATNATLRLELEEAERIRKRLEENLRDLTEKHTIGQMQLNAMNGNSSGEKLVQATERLMSVDPLRIFTDNFYRNEAVMSTRKLYLEATQELTSVNSRLAELQAELSSRDRELLAARADCKSPQNPDLNMKADVCSGRNRSRRNGCFGGSETNQRNHHFLLQK
jgi:protein HOOK3